MTSTVVVTALLLIIAPLLLGLLIGLGLQRVWGHRLAGLGFGLAAVLLPAAVVIGVLGRFPVVGFWDAGLEGLLLGAGVLVGMHRSFADVRDLALSGVAMVAGLFVLEFAVRGLLPPAPVFPSSNGLHLWLSDSIRAASATQGWDMRSREIACSLIYGEQYSGILDVSGERDISRPALYAPRPDARTRVLHVGDSMVFGLGVERSETFTAALARLEPEVEHVNAGIPGLAPDAYLAVLRAWIARHHFDDVVMYIFPGNDLRDLDGPYPCCDFEPLLVYDARGAHLRCVTARPIDLSRAGFEWLRYNSPPPYLVRAVIDRSSAAAYLGAAMVEAGHRYSLTAQASPSQQMEHFATVLRTARAELNAQGTGFRVVILPPRDWVESAQPSPEQLDQVIAIGRDLGVPMIDASSVLRTAIRHGEDVFVGPRERNDPHFNPNGHRLVAEWLHRNWSAAVAGS
jgi:hypothetical protein